MVLLGAFDPPTNAHVELLRAAAASEGASPAWGTTKVLLARPPSELFGIEERIVMLDEIAARLGFGLLFANRGTYLDVHRALRAAGFDATFLVGADKLAQLSDPAFYPDGERGVAATFDDVSFLVIPRDDVPILAPGVRTLEAPELFADGSLAELSASRVRRMVSEGSDVSHLVPPEVGLAIEGYTRAR
jgi:nicotinic acid mononucleotide adenylyltransferase